MLANLDHHCVFCKHSNLPDNDALMCHVRGKPVRVKVARSDGGECGVEATLFEQRERKHESAS